MDVLEILENHEARIRRLEKTLKDLIDNGTGGLKIFNSITDFPNPGQDGFIYLDQSTGISYYWDGTQYLPLSQSTVPFQVFPTSADFPSPGIHGVLYMAEDTGNLYFWNGATYVNSGGGLKVFPDVASFPQPGEPTFIYYAQLEKTLYFWDGIQYSPLVDPKDFIQNQFASGQNANFWITGQVKVGINMGIGMGTLVPNYKLEVEGNVTGLNPTTENGLSFGNNRSGTGGESNIVWSSNNGNSRHLEFGFWDGTTYTPAMYVGPTGGLNITGIFVPANKTVDPAGVGGAMFFRGDTQKLRVFQNGAWQDVLTTDSVTGQYIQNQNAAAQNANFWIVGTGKITSAGQPTMEWYQTAGAGYGVYIPFHTSGINLGYFSLGDSGREENLMSISVPTDAGHPGSGGNFQVDKAVISNVGFNAQGVNMIQFDYLTGIWMGRTGPSTTFGTGPKTFFIYDNEFSKYRLSIKSNGNWVIGGSNISQDNGAAVQITDGPISLQPANADPAITPSSLFYRADTNKFRASINGVWKNLATEEDGVNSGRTIYVDSHSPNATDNRAGIPVGSMGRPFATIQAALTALGSAQQAEPAAHTIVVESGDYYGDMVPISPANIYLKPGAKIFGTFNSAYALSIIGSRQAYYLDNYGSLFPSISANSANPAIFGDGAADPYPTLTVHGVIVTNTGTGEGITSTHARVFDIANCVVSSVGAAISYSGYQGTNIRDSYLKSTGNVTIYGGNQHVKRCVVITSSPTAGHHAIYLGNSSSFWVEDCRIHSQAGCGVTGSNWGGTMVFRNNYSNTYEQAVNSVTGAGAVGQQATIECTNNIMNVRNPSTTECVYMRMDSGTSIPASPGIFIGNKFNTPSFFVQVAGQPLTAVDNHAGLAFGVDYPRIGNIWAPTSIFMEDSVEIPH
jgi:hypothetical protein